VSSQKKEFDLTRKAAKFLLDEPFFAAVSRRIDKHASYEIPTAGMRVNDNGTFTLLYNPEYMGELTDAEITDVLKHEFYHIIFEHVAGRMPEGKVTKLWNFATDLAINSYLRNLPEGALVPGEYPFEHLPRKLTAEKYYKILKKQQQEEESKGGKGSGTQSLQEIEEFDDHGGWEQSEGQGDSQGMARERMKKILKDAVKEMASSSSSSWGSISSDIKEKIIAAVDDSSLDWRKVLRYFIKTSQKANKSSTVKRINRRYPYLHPGRKSSRQAKIAISIDQSGSVSTDMLHSFFSELNKLAEIASFTVVPFDTKVGEEHVFEWKKGQRYKHQRVLTGGTCFDAPTSWVNERDFDGHIILTDMCANKPIPSKCQRMWMTTPSNAKKPYFQTNERIVAINYDEDY
jgi:predicted metal-dependent peptidase